MEPTTMNKSDNVKNYLKNVMDYFVQIRQNYYTEHARLQSMNIKFKNFWNILTGVLQISDPSIIRRGQEGDVSAEEVQEIITDAVRKKEEEVIRDLDGVPYQDTDNLLDALKTEFDKVIYGKTDTDITNSESLDNIKSKLIQKHKLNEITQIAQIRLMDNAIAFNQIFSEIHKPVVTLFAVADTN